MLLSQFFLLALIAWRMLGPNFTSVVESHEVVVLKERLAQLEGKERSRVQQQAQQEILQMIVDAKAGQPDFVEKYSELKTTLEESQSNLSAQLSLAKQLNLEQLNSASELAEKTRINDRLSGQLQTAHQELQAARAKAESLAGNSKAGSAGESQTGLAGMKNFELPWWAAIASGLAVLGLGAGAGYLFGKSDHQTELSEDDEPRR